MTATSLAPVRPSDNPPADDYDTDYAEVYAPRHTTGRVYLAYPLTVANTKRCRTLERAARRFFPNAQLLPAGDLFSSNADWRERWRDVLPTLRAVVVFTDSVARVGYGVWTEVRDALARGIPVYLLLDFGWISEFGYPPYLIPWQYVELVKKNPRDLRAYATLRARKEGPTLAELGHDFDRLHERGWIWETPDEVAARARRLAGRASFASDGDDEDSFHWGGD